jgi:hypothetical protein
VRRPAHEHDLAHREGKDQGHVLGHHRQLARQRAPPEGAERTAADGDAPRLEADDARGGAQERRLAGAVGPRQRQHLARGDRQRDVAQDLALAQAHANPAQLEGRLAHDANALAW